MNKFQDRYFWQEYHIDNIVFFLVYYIRRLVISDGLVILKLYFCNSFDIHLLFPRKANTPSKLLAERNQALFLKGTEREVMPV